MRCPLFWADGNRRHLRGVSQMVMSPAKFLLALVCAAGVYGQQFEVASIRPTPPDTRVAPKIEMQGGRFTAINTSLRQLLKKAYAIRDFQFAGEPDWIDSSRYDIAAKTEAGRTVTAEQLQNLLRNLLTSRFNFLGHMESKDLPIYALRIAKNGPKLRAATADPGPDAGVRFGGASRLVGVAASAEQLAEGLSDILFNGSPVVDRPVLDETKLPALYDFTLVWAPVESDLPESSIFTALQEQLGLRLESRKAAVSILVIERVEKPSAN